MAGLSAKIAIGRQDPSCQVIESAAPDDRRAGVGVPVQRRRFMVGTRGLRSDGRQEAERSPAVEAGQGSLDHLASRSDALCCWSACRSIVSSQAKP